MKYLKLTKWESNVIQVGLDHINDEFEFITDKQHITNLSLELDGFIIDKSVEFPINKKNIVLITMAITEIYIMHQDLLREMRSRTIDEWDDKELSQDCVSACKSIFNKLMMGVK